MRKIIFILILAVIPFEGFAQPNTEDRVLDSLVIFCNTPLCIINEFKLVVNEDSLTLSHRYWSRLDTLLSDYVCYDSDTIFKMIQYYNEFSKVKTTYIKPDSIIHVENYHGVVICAYSKGNKTYNETIHDKNQLYPFSYLRFLAIINNLLKEHIDIKITFPFNTGPDPSFLHK